MYKTIYMATIKEIQKLTGWSKKEVKKNLKGLLEKKIIVQVGEEYLTIPDFIDMVNKYNNDNPDNQITI